VHVGEITGLDDRIHPHPVASSARIAISVSCTMRTLQGSRPQLTVQRRQPRVPRSKKCRPLQPSSITKEPLGMWRVSPEITTFGPVSQKNPRRANR